MQKLFYSIQNERGRGCIQLVFIFFQRKLIKGNQEVYTIFSQEIIEYTLNTPLLFVIYITCIYVVLPYRYMQKVVYSIQNERGGGLYSTCIHFFAKETDQG